MMDCLPQLHVAAIHDVAGYRSEVPGLGVLCALPDERIIGAGVYQNSVGAQSTYAIAGTYLGAIHGVRYGVIGGTVNGYPAGNGDFIPMAAAIVSLPFNGIDVHLTFIPSVTNYTPTVVQLSVTFK